jgi:hypothetical protein
MAYSQIENKYLNALVELEFPTATEEEPSLEGMQLAAGPSDTRTDAGPRFGRGGVTKAQSQAAGGLEKPLTALADTGAGFAREATATGLGILGDIESIKNAAVNVFSGPNDKPLLDRFLEGLEQKTKMATSEQISKEGFRVPFTDTQVKLPPAIPPGVQDQKDREISAGVGGAFGKIAPLPTILEGGIAASVAAAKGAKAVGTALAPATADVIEMGLRKAGMIMDITPEGPAQVVIPVKVGEREVKIPANQAATLQKALKNLTPEEQAKFRSDTASKFVSILKQLPSKEEFGAASIAGKAKKGWYEGSTQAIVQVFGPDSSRFAALLSATSPQTSVESNLFNALQVWKNWTAAGRPTDRESIVRVMGQSVQGSKGEESVLDAWINNSVRALSAEDPSTVVLSGPKVNSFMLNLQGNVNEVTNDAWMAAFTYVDQNLFSGSLTKGGDPGKGPGYIAMNARVRETATYLTKITGETWTPAEVQETIWSWAKTLYETAGAKGEKRSAVQLIQDNAITDELIAATPDFRTLFYDERFAPILEQAGYSDQLSQLRAATSGSDATAGAKKPGSSGQASSVDADSQRKYLERNAKRLDKLRADREKEAAAKAKAKTQTPTGGVE